MVQPSLVRVLRNVVGSKICYLEIMRTLIALIFLSLNLQGQPYLELLERYAVVSDNDEFAKELIDNGFTLDWHPSEDYERQLTKDHLRIGLIDKAWHLQVSYYVV